MTEIASTEAGAVEWNFSVDPYERSRDLGRLVALADLITWVGVVQDNAVSVDIERGEIGFTVKPELRYEQYRDVGDFMREAMDMREEYGLGENEYDLPANRTLFTGYIK